MNVIVSKSLPIKYSEIHIYFLFCEFLHGIFIHCMPICERSSEFRLKFLKISAAVWSASLTNEWNEKLMNKGQLISKRLLEKIVWTKIATKKFDNFCPGGQIKKIKTLYYIKYPIINIRKCLYFF